MILRIPRECAKLILRTLVLMSGSRYEVKIQNVHLTSINQLYQYCHA